MGFSLLDWERDTPIFAAETAIVQDGQVLLIRRGDMMAWAFPGGFVDPGESVEQAAVREAREETGLEVRLTRLLGVYSRPRWRGVGVHHVAFVARPVGGRLTTSPETLEVRYFLPHALPRTLFPWYLPRVHQALSAEAAPVVVSQDITWPTREELLELDACLPALRDDRLEGALAAWWARWARECAPG